ncbi:hypothetical protein FRC02_009862 [Tulasnella sp. 418]|nr:hypothetical protein FRC02_009862 [Tulasnella sp. 418]
MPYGDTQYYGRGGAGRTPKQLPTISATTFTGTRKEPSIGLHTPESSDRSSSAYASSIAGTTSSSHLRRSSIASSPYAPSVGEGSSAYGQSSIASSSYAPSIAEGGSGYAPSVTSSAYAPSVRSQPHSYSRRLPVDRSHRSVSPGQSISRKNSFTGTLAIESEKNGLVGWNGISDSDYAQETATYFDQGLLESGAVDVGYLSSSPGLRHRKSQPHFIDSLSTDGSGSEANYAHRSARGALTDTGLGAGTQHVVRRSLQHASSRGHHTPNPPYPYPHHRPPHPLHHVSSFENYSDRPTETNSDYEVQQPSIIHEEATPVVSNPMFATGTPEESPHPPYPYTPDPSVSPYSRSPSASLRHQQSQGLVRRGTPGHLPLSLGQSQFDTLTAPLTLPPNDTHSLSSPPPEMADLTARAAQMHAQIQQQAQAQAQAAINAYLLNQQQHQQALYSENHIGLTGIGAVPEQNTYNTSSILNSVPVAPNVNMNDSMQAIYALLASAGLSVPPSLLNPSATQNSVPAVPANPLVNSLAGLDLTSALGQLSLSIAGLGNTLSPPPNVVQVNSGDGLGQAHSQSHTPESQGVASPDPYTIAHQQQQDLLAQNVALGGEEAESEVSEVPPPPYSQHHEPAHHHSSQYNARNFAPAQSQYQPSSSALHQPYPHVHEHTNHQLPVMPSPPLETRTRDAGFGITQQLEGGGADVSMYQQQHSQQYQQSLSPGLSAPPHYGLPLSSTQGF